LTGKPLLKYNLLAIKSESDSGAGGELGGVEENFIKVCWVGKILGTAGQLGGLPPSPQIGLGKTHRKSKGTGMCGGRGRRKGIDRR